MAVSEAVRKKVQNLPGQPGPSVEGREGEDHLRRQGPSTFATA